MQQKDIWECANNADWQVTLSFILLWLILFTQPSTNSDMNPLIPISLGLLFSELFSKATFLVAPEDRPESKTALLIVDHFPSNSGVLLDATRQEMEQTH